MNKLTLALILALGVVQANAAQVAPAVVDAPKAASTTQTPRVARPTDSQVADAQQTDGLIDATAQGFENAVVGELTTSTLFSAKEKGWMKTHPVITTTLFTATVLAVVYALARWQALGKTGAEANWADTILGVYTTVGASISGVYNSTQSLVVIGIIGACVLLAYDLLLKDKSYLASLFASSPTTNGSSITAATTSPGTDPSSVTLTESSKRKKQKPA